MPSEYILRNKAKEFFAKEKYQFWFASKTKWKKESDIFGIWDCICWRGDEIVFVQITTLKNWRARQKKIINYMLKNGVYFNPPKTEGWIMAWTTKKKEWEIKKIEDY